MANVNLYSAEFCPYGTEVKHWPLRMVEYIEAAKALGANNFRIIVSAISCQTSCRLLIVLATLNFGMQFDYVRDGFWESVPSLPHRNGVQCCPADVNICW